MNYKETGRESRPGQPMLDLAAGSLGVRRRRAAATRVDTSMPSEASPSPFPLEDIRSEVVTLLGALTDNEVNELVIKLKTHLEERVSAMLSDE